MRAFLSCLTLLAVLACGGEISAPVDIESACREAAGVGIDARLVPKCLHDRRLIPNGTFIQADSILNVAASIADTSSVPPDQDAFAIRAEVRRAMQHVSEFYERGLLDDSARFNRVIDHVAVTLDFLSGALTPQHPGWPRYFSKRTPYLTWVYYPGTGIYFQPVSSIQNYEYNFAVPWASTDSLLRVADAMYRYAIWHTVDGHRFPVWEYLFPFNSGGVQNDAPWQSGMAQGLCLLVFTQLYERTGDTKWLTRANQVFESYKVTWDKGGIMLSDTTQGYWFEEFSPRALVWNGSVLANIELDYFARVTHNSDAARMAARGYARIRAVTHLYDSGSWTYYSMVQGYNSVGYHDWYITLADTLYARTGDPYYRDLGARWRTYTPPAGVSNLVPLTPLLH
jgi:D-glucuronyl C5-epimerase-like protein